MLALCDFSMGNESNLLYFRVPFRHLAFSLFKEKKKKTITARGESALSSLNRMIADIHVAITKSTHRLMHETRKPLERLTYGEGNGAMKSSSMSMSMFISSPSLPLLACAMPRTGKPKAGCAALFPTPTVYALPVLKESRDAPPPVNWVCSEGSPVAKVDRLCCMFDEALDKPVAEGFAEHNMVDSDACELVG